MYSPYSLCAFAYVNKYRVSKKETIGGFTMYAGYILKIESRGEMGEFCG